jgi:hypothetical protein
MDKPTSGYAKCFRDIWRSPEWGPSDCSGREMGGGVGPAGDQVNATPQTPFSSPNRVLSEVSCNLRYNVWCIGSDHVTILFIEISFFPTHLFQNIPALIYPKFS